MAQQHRRRSHLKSRWFLSSMGVMVALRVVSLAVPVKAVGTDIIVSSLSLREDVSIAGSEEWARSETARGVAAQKMTLRVFPATGGDDNFPLLTDRQSKGSDPSSKGAEAALATEAVAGGRVRDAIQTLRVVGAAVAAGPGCRLCHPSTDEFGAYGLPLCGDSTSVFKPFGDGRLGGKNRSPVGAVSLPCAVVSSSPRMLTEEEENDEANEGDRSYVYYVQNGIGALCCVCIAALAAGLTMGLLSLDPLLLLIKIRAGETEKERNQAANLLPLVKQHHRLLVSLLLLNSIANEALPLFLDNVVPGYVAVILSVTLVLFFGEIIPSALFTGPNQMAIASRLSPLVKFVMALLCPIAYPIAKLLDWVMHEEGENHEGNSHVGSLYNRSELSALVRIQYEERMASKKRRKSEIAKLANAKSAHAKDALAAESAGNDADAATGKAHRFGMTQYDIAIRKELERSNTAYPPSAIKVRDNSGTDEMKQRSPSDYRAQIRAPSIHLNEVKMVEGTLSLKTKKALDVFTPLRRVFAVPYDQVLSEDICVAIYRSGYSRIPIFARDTTKKDNVKENGLEEKEDTGAICGLLLTKHLIVLSPEDERPVSTLPLQQPVCVPPNINLVDLIGIFQKGGSASKGGHMAVVCARPLVASAALEKRDPIPKSAGVMGIVTLEDVIEELLQE